MNEIHKAQADRIQHIFDSFEKARTVHPIGMIKEMGGRKYIKTPTGWKYHGKGKGAKAQAHAREHGKKEGQSSSSQATTEDKAKKLLAELKQRSESGQEGMLIDPAAKDAPHIKQLVDQGAVSIENNRISYVQPASSSSEPTMREVLANPDAKFMVETIEEYISDLRTDPGRKEHMEGLKSAVEELKNMTGYKYDIKEQEDAHKQATKSSNKVKNTAKVPGGDRVQKIGIGGRYDKEPIRMPGSVSLKTAEGIRDIESKMKDLTIAARAKYLESTLKAIKKDSNKADSYRKFTDREALAAKIKLADFRKKYVGKTTAEDKRVKIEIDSTNKMKINGKEVEIDDDSSFVKLGGGGRQSASGGMYAAGHFDGQLQGRGYVGKTKMLRSSIQNGKSIGEAVKSLMETSRDKAEAKKVVEHLGLTKFI